ncbi:hypothetical protein BDZ88DRAFT_428870 [Geranomyces variabilis]|nr:hypothetical protein BDZ88DRAFT_428870 [Geranomyces variabilis]KAJ3132309.1 hypothetical protein HDU90_007369 [Geranomyces variabilis]
MTFGKLFRSDPPAVQQQQQQQRPSRRRSSASASAFAPAASASPASRLHRQQKLMQQAPPSLCSAFSSSSSSASLRSVASSSHRRQDSACSTSSSSSQHHSTAESLADLAIYSRSPKQALYVLHRIKELKREALRLERAKAGEANASISSSPSGSTLGAAARWSLDSSGGSITVASAAAAAAASPLSSSLSPCCESPSPSAAAAAAADAWFKYAKYILDHAHRLEFDRHDWLQEAIDLIRELSKPHHHHPLAQTLHAELLTNGPPHQHHSDSSSSVNNESCSNNTDINAAAAAAEARSRPILVQRDNEGAFRLYRSAASAGVAEAAYRAAMMIRDRRVAWGGDTKTESNRLLDAAARQTHPGALHVLAQDLLAVRPGRTADELKRGLAMLVAAAHAATRRYPQALHDLALVYARGVPELNIKADDTSAMNLLLDAADMNHAPSLHALGKRYAALAASADDDMDDTQRTQHTLAMVQHISRAAQLAYPPAQLALSKLHLSGVPCAGLQRDPARAFLLARTAALAGSPAACCVVAIFVRQREVVRCSEPRREARMWLLRAVRAGSETAKRHLEALDREEMEEQEEANVQANAV